MVISDLVTSKEIDVDSVNTENWCSCIDGALTKENYIDSIKKAGFTNIEILDEKLYMELDEDKDQVNQEKRQITSISIRAVQAIISTRIREVIYMKFSFGKTAL